MKFFVIPLLTLYLCACTAISEPTKPDKSAPSIKYPKPFVFERYVKFKAKKAIAMSFGERGEFYMGWASEFPTQELANQQAMAKCKEYQQKDGFEGQCNIVMEGHRLSDTTSGETPYTDLSDLDLSILNYVKRTSKYGAYAAAIDEGGRWSGGYSWGYENQEQADKRAIKECESRKEKDSTISECKVIMQDAPKTVTPQRKKDGNEST